MQSLWEHATVQMPPALDVLPTVLDELANRFGGELLYMMPIQVSSGLIVGGRPQLQQVWTLVLRFPAGGREKALAFIPRMFQPESPADDVAGVQTLTLEGGCKPD